MELDLITLLYQLESAILVSKKTGFDRLYSDKVEQFGGLEQADSADITE